MKSTIILALLGLMSLHNSNAVQLHSDISMLDDGDKVEREKQPDPEEE